MLHAPKQSWVQEYQEAGARCSMYLQPILWGSILGQVAERVDVAQVIPAVCVHLLRQLLVCMHLRKRLLSCTWRVHAIECIRDDA
jgi:hypothetical protein